MILHINYWHKTATGEASNIIKVERPTEAEAYRKAHQEYFNKCAAYAADASVIDYSVSIVNPKTGAVAMPFSYVTPDLMGEEMPE